MLDGAFRLPQVLMVLAQLAVGGCPTSFIVFQAEMWLGQWCITYL